MENAVLNVSKISANALKTITTVGALMGPKGKLAVTESNLLRTEKAVTLQIFNEKNEGWRIICSSALSKSIRDKETKLSELHNCPIIEYTTQGTGESIPMVTFPEGSGLVVEVSAEKNTKGPIERKSLYKPEDLIAF